MTEIITPHLSVGEKIEQMLTLFDNRRKQRDTTIALLGVEAYQLALESGEKQLWIKASTAISGYYTEITSEFDKAIKYIKDGISLLDDETDFEIKSEFYRRLGLNYDYLGELILSKLAYDDSIRLLENRENLSEPAFLTLARSLFNQSIIYGDLELDTLHHNYLVRAFEYFTKGKNNSGIARCYISFGVEEYDKKDYNKALDYYLKAIEIADEINDVPPYCIAMGNCGIVYTDLDEFEKAIECAEKSIARVQNQANKHFELSTYQMAGRVYQVAKNFEKADYWFAEAHRMNKEMGKVVDNFELYRFWGETLKELGRYEEAFEKLNLFIQQKDELHKAKGQAALNDATLRFNYEEGKKEQELLKKKNAEIEQYTHKLEMSNYELNQFAHVASHDMKEPLRMISNYSQLLEKSLNGSLNVDQKDYIYYINDGAKRMMGVIQSLLQLSKINSAQNKEEVDMNEVLEEVKQALNLEIHEKNAHIKSVFLPKLFADRIHIMQLMQNLVSNGMKYNKTGSPVIDITYDQCDRFHYIEIADNGIGIPVEYREKVFIIFQRLHDRHEFDGTGIGLAICKKIIDSLGGKIWIEDSPLGGSKFCFKIPK